MKSKSILLVGGAGYVGSILARELLERGYSVKIFDRLYFGKIGIKEIESQVELVVGDMRLMDPAVLDNVEVVINLGGLSNDPTAEYNPKANYEMNTTATKKLAELCKKHGIKRYILASSCSVYYVDAAEREKDILLDEETEINPKAAYSRSKYEAEQILLSMADKDFCPIILRQGTIYGFSPRMRYDLVVNTFIKDVLTKGYMTIFYGGEMWRPLVEVRDAARAYIACMGAKEEMVSSQIFNVAYSNFRISELALHVQQALQEIGIKAEIKADYRYRGVRSYRVSCEKIKKVLDFEPTISIEESVKDLIEKIREFNYMDFDNPIYYNIRWMKLLEEAEKIISITGSVFDAPSEINSEDKSLRLLYQKDKKIGEG